MKIPDSTMAEDDLIFKAINYHRPRNANYIAEWRKIEKRASGEPRFARQVEASIRKFIPKERQ